MRTLLNIIWVVFGGFWLFLGYIVFGLLACFLIAGLWLAIGHVVTAAMQAITIIGIPLAVANIKLIPVTCFPFGKQIVETR